MNRNPGSSRWTAIDTVSYLMIASVFGRMIPYYLPTTERWLVIGLLVLYLLLFTAARFVSRRFSTFLYPYFVIQMVITVILNLVIPSYDGPQDYFIMLIFPLCIQAMWRLPQKIGTIWCGFFAVTCGASMIIYYQMYEGSWEGIGYGLAYVAAAIMISVFSSVTLRAEEARNQSLALNAELEAANQKLKEYAQQVEKLAAAQERTRLARDLHDSVSQTIFSMTLTAQAASILLESDPKRVAAQLEHLQALAKNAMAEMRALIQQLRPEAPGRDGLAASLRHHVEERKLRDGLAVELNIRGERRLPIRIEEGLFRVVQESLNNVVKHAKVNTARVTLDLEQNPIEVCIEDHGAGFDPAPGQTEIGHLGLAGMVERVQALGGRLEIESKPGAGTCIRVRDLNVEEGEHAG
jgi:signal transduction histidine kinase